MDEWVSECRRRRRRVVPRPPTGASSSSFADDLLIQVGAPKWFVTGGPGASAQVEECTSKNRLIMIYIEWIVAFSDTSVGSGERS